MLTLPNGIKKVEASDNAITSNFNVNADLLDTHIGQTTGLLINGGFAVNQRVKSGTVLLSAGQYGHDRWKAGSSGCTYTFATSGNVVTITITAGTLMQVIEGINLYSGTYTLSWKGTAQGKISAGSFGSSGVASAVVGGTNTAVEFSTGTLSKVQFNAGNVALPFQPRSFGEELALCQRYYEKSYDYAVAPGTANASHEAEHFTSVAPTFIAGKANYKTRKRVSPTIAVYAPVSGSQNSANNATDGTAFALTGVTTSGETGITLIEGTGFTTGGVYRFHYTADAEI